MSKTGEPDAYAVLTICGSHLLLPLDRATAAFQMLRNHEILETTYTGGNSGWKRAAINSYNKVELRHLTQVEYAAMTLGE